MGSEPTAVDAEAELTERPPPDALSRAVARARIAGALFGKSEPVKLGRYQLLEHVGVGGMGIVWGAWDPELDRKVAIKLVKTELVSARERIVREGQALAKLSHPNVVPIYDVGVFEEQVYLVMEWVRGQNLRTWIATPRTDREIAAVYCAAGHGLAAAHAEGLIHRDFKPDNAMVGDDGRVRVLDFGLASSDPDDGTPAGTPTYMAPEQVEARMLTPAVDQFALGVSLREALGTEPPRWLGDVIARATAPDPTARFPSMTTLADALGRDPRRTWRQRVIIVGAIAVAVGAFAIGTLRAGGPEQPSCDVMTDDLAEVWSAARAAALRPAFGALAPRIEALVGDWTTRWRAQQREACESTNVTHVQSATMLDLRAACLERARAGLVAAVDVMSLPGTVPNAAIEAATRLPNLRDCADVRGLMGTRSLPTTPGEIASSAGVEALYARARALRNAGKNALALAAGRDAVAMADAIHDPGASARARVELASSTLASGKLAGVLETFEEAARFAAEAKDDALAAAIWLNVVDALALRLDKPGEAERLLVVADAAIVRAGSPPRLVSALAGSRGDLALHQDHPEVALPLLEQRLRGDEEFGSSDPDLARVHNRIATALSALYRMDEARAHLDQAQKLLESHYGPNHPNLGVILTTRGALEYRVGNFTAAVEMNQRALAIKEATMGPQHIGLLPTLMNLALAQSGLGRSEDAVITAQRGLAIAEAALPAKHPRLGFTLSDVSEFQLETHAWDAATLTNARAIEILEPLGEHSPLDEVLRVRSALRLHAHDIAGAQKDAARAVAIASAMDGAWLETARALSQLADVRIAAGDPASARSSLEHALELVTKSAGAKHPLSVTISTRLAGLR